MRRKDAEKGKRVLEMMARKEEMLKKLSLLRHNASDNSVKLCVGMGCVELPKPIYDTLFDAVIDEVQECLYRLEEELGEL